MFIMHLPPDQFETIGPIAWADIWKRWQTDETHNPDWKRHWEERGYSSWEDWRKDRSDMLHCATREWALFHLPQPLVTVPALHGGPFKSWMHRYHGKTSAPFSSVIHEPDMLTNTKVQSVLEQFPTSVQLVGLFCINRILIFEGMHRCCAMTRMAEEGTELHADISIAIANCSDVTDDQWRQIAAKAEKTSA